MKSTQAFTLFEEVGYSEKSLKRAHNTLNSLEERVWLLNDEVVVTSVYHFERDIKHASLLYPDLDLSPMIPFQVVQDIQLVGDEYFLLF